MQGSVPIPDANLTRQREVVDAFLAASRGGDFNALLALLDPDAVLRADRAAVNVGRYRGGERCDGWAPGGRPCVVFDFTITRGKIIEIHLVADPERLRQLDLTVLND